MRKIGILAWILAFALLMPLIAVGDMGAAAQRSFFTRAPSSYDDETIAQALCPVFHEDTVPVSAAPEAGDAGSYWIVRFTDTLTDEEICERLNGLEAVALASGEDRLFRIRTRDISAFEEKNGSVLAYCCADMVRTACELPDDPELAGDPVYELIRVPEAWERTEADPDLVIAVLDSGVFRGHDDFVGVPILNGYDAVENHAGIQKDVSGHGTAVIGLIGAAAGNGSGSAGICHGAQILPVRITSEDKGIYSSNFVRGLRFAADAGARIINLSFGGYSYSAAEYDAVRYALSKGCILIAAAGNDGDDTHGKDPCYPAAYEGVIAVGSCGLNGQRSLFSQFTDDIQILAPGEQMLVPAYDEEGNSIYVRKNGTSFSAAVVTGVAGLVLSSLDEGVRFETEEFLALLAKDSVPETGVGYGVVDALYAVTHANDPLISGVVSGQTYSSKRSVRFNRGTATLDGEEFEDGDTVYTNGIHQLTVTDGERIKTVTFRLSYQMPSYHINEDGSNLSVTFSGWEATLDGVPYRSGDPVTGAGCHLLVLSDSFGDRKDLPLYVNASVPAAAGAEDGAVYDRPVRVLFAEEGNVTVNGEPFSSPYILTEDGDYEVRWSDLNSSRRRTVTFRIKRSGQPLEADPADTELFADDENGWYATFGNAVPGLRLHRMENGESKTILEEDSIRQVARIEGGVVVLSDRHVAVFDPDTVFVEEGGVQILEIESAAVCAGGIVYVLSEGSLLELDPRTGSLTPLKETDADDLLTDGTRVYLHTAGSGLLETFGQDRVRVLPAGKANGMLLTEEWSFASGKAYRYDWENAHADAAVEGTLRFTFSGKAIACADGFLYTSVAVYRLEDGALMGHYGENMRGRVKTEALQYVVKEGGGIVAYPADALLYAPVPEQLYTEPVRTSAFMNSYYWYGLSDVESVAADGDRFCVLFRRLRRAVVCSGGQLEREILLPFEPSDAALNGDSLCIYSAESGMVWVDGTVYVPAFPFWNAWYANDRLYLSGSTLVAFENGQWIDTGLSGDASCGSGSLIARIADGALIVSDGNVTQSVPSDASMVWTDGVYVIADETVYKWVDGELESWMELPDRPMDVCDGCAVSWGGFALLDTREVLDSFYAENARYAGLGSSVGVVFYSDGDELRQFCLNGDPPETFSFWNAPEPEGCADGLLYHSETTLVFSAGLGFLDGEPIASGTVVREPGEHAFLLVLPCGMEYRRRFRVMPDLAGISFLRSSYKLAVNEEGSMPVLFLPEGASRIPLVYTADSDCVEVRGDGTFRALKEGTAVITATTEDGLYSAACTVEVTAAVLLFDPESGLSVDRIDALIRGVPENTSAQEIVSAILSAGVKNVSQDPVGTGTVVTLLADDGSELDRLTAVVTGDLDGDGFVTLGDLMILEAILEEDGTEDPILRAAGDIDQNGSLTGKDVNWLRQILLFERGPSRHAAPPEAEEGEAELLIPSRVTEGETIRVLIALNECESAVGFSGRLVFNAERFTFVRVESYLWEISVSEERNGRVAFVGKGDEAGDLHPVLSVLLQVNPSADGSGGSGLLPGSTGAPDSQVVFIRDLVAVWEDRVRSLARKSVEVTPLEPDYGELNISVAGMDPFDPEQHAYEVSLPYNTFWVDYQLTRPENVRVEVSSPVFVKENRLEVVFRVFAEDGSIQTYTVLAYRDGTRPKSKDSTLGRLSVSGYALSFSPDVTEYVLTVPRGTDHLTLDFEPSDKRAVAVQEGPETDGEGFVLLVRVTAEDGSQTVYRVRAVWEEERSEPEVSVPEPPDDKKVNGWLIAGILFAVLAGAAAAALVLLRKKKNSRPEKTADGTEQNEEKKTESGDEEPSATDAGDEHGE